MGNKKKRLIQLQSNCKFGLTVLLICLLQIMQMTSGQAQLISDEALDKIVYKKIAEFPLETQFSIGYVSDGEVSFEGVIHSASGFQKIDNAHSVFEIGSITKVFTAYLLASAVKSGEIDLDDDIWEELESQESDQPKITYEQLSNHTSGLPRLSDHVVSHMVDAADPYKAYGAEELQEYINDTLKLENDPGQKYSYSNVGAGLLGFSVARILGGEYRDVMKREVLDRIKMSSSFLTPEDVKTNLVGGIGFAGKPTVNWHFGALGGAGCMLSTAQDMMLFVKANFKKSKELKLMRKKTFEVNEYLDMGLGWHIIKSTEGHTLYFHNGGTGGYTSFLSLDTKRKLGVVILTNVSGFHPKMTDIDKMGFSLMKELGKGK